MRVYQGRVYPPPKGHEIQEKEDEEEAAAKSQYDDDFDDISSVGTTRSARTVKSIAGRMSVSGKSLGASECGTAKINALRELQRMRKIRNVNDDLDHQIYTGWVEANLEYLTVDETQTLFKKVAQQTEIVDALRITCLPREYEIPWEDRNKPTCEVPFYRYGRKEHRILSRTKSDLLLGEVLRVYFTRMVNTAMKPKHELVHLELGVALSDGGLTNLGELIASSDTLERLSLCGSCVGDHGLVVLKDGIHRNKSLRELDLTGCALTDLGAAVISSFLKGHATCRSNKFWQEMLREYPSQTVSKSMRARMFDQKTAQVQSRVARAEGGLLLLELRENKITDEGAAHLYNALQIDSRLSLLSLRRNKISLEWQEVFAALLNEHPSLQQVMEETIIRPLQRRAKPSPDTHTTTTTTLPTCTAPRVPPPLRLCCLTGACQVDLRGNRSSYMGIIRKRTMESGLMLHLRTTKKNVSSWKGIPISQYPLKEIYNLRLENALNTQRAWAFRKKTDKELKEEADTAAKNYKFAFQFDDEQDLMDVTCPPSEPPARKEKTLKDLITKAPRLQLHEPKGTSTTSNDSSSSPMVKAGRQKVPSKDGSSSRLSAGKAPRGAAASRASLGKQVSFRGAGRAASAQATVTKGRKRRKKKAPGNEEMVEEMSGVLLQMHNLVSQFEGLAYNDPEAMAKAAAFPAPNRSPASPALQDIAAQLKQLHELDDSVGVGPYPTAAHHG